MKEIIFEWDSKKAAVNWVKHGISFAEASTVFSDETAIVFDDPEHSDFEERMLIIGFSAYARLLIVCHCVRGQDSIRIISARKATKPEARQYTNINRGW